MQQATPPTMRPPAAEADSATKVGTTLDGRYRLDALIGEGGAGQVYRATHLTLSRPVAVKLLLQEHEISAVAKARFSREAKTLAALRHPNIVTVIDFGVSDVPFLVLELVQGCELEELVAEGPLSTEDALSIIKQLLGALAYAHEAGVIHRDLKPSNLFVRRLPSGLHVEVLDFGLAKFIRMDDDDAPGETDVKVTRAGNIVGTPAYMAPEQCAGDNIDERADQYGATIVLVEMLTGQLPFDSPDVLGLLRSHLAESPPTLSELAPDKKFSARLEALVARGLAKDPDDRFADMPAMLAALDALPELGGAPEREDSGVLETAKRAVAELGSAFAKSVEQPGEPDAAKTPTNDTKTRLPAPPKALLVGTAAVFVIALFFWMARDEGSETGPPLSAPEPPNAEAQSVDESPDANQNPWAEVPDELAAYKSTLDSGRRLRNSQLGSLRAYSINNPGDPRALLLYGRAYVARGWLSHALPKFIAAFETDINARNDPEMLQNLVHMATTDALEREAADAIRRIYGNEARAALTKAIGDEPEADRRTRLQRLLISL